MTDSPKERGVDGQTTRGIRWREVSGLSARRALPALILGSSVFLQVHLVLGLLLGPLADRAFNQAKGPALAAAAVLVAGIVTFWLVRRRKRGSAAGWTEASCPVCMGVTLLSDRIPALAGLGDLVAGVDTAAAVRHRETRRITTPGRPTSRPGGGGRRRWAEDRRESLRPAGTGMPPISRNRS